MKIVFSVFDKSLPGFAALHCTADGDDDDCYSDAGDDDIVALIL